jgi:DNA invertase Pin-like site-specific DNA recombinase
MAVSTAPVATGTQLGYARVSTGHQSLDQQVDALTGAGVYASRVYSDELELELGRERRSAAREARRARGQHIGRPKVLDEKKAALALRMHGSGESASTIATALSVSRATVYRVLALGAGKLPVD